jgi:CubicO group peptidase (beta-lactamase class C family)
VKRAALIVLALLVVVGAGAAWYLRPIAPIATGYAAQITCGGVFLQGRDVEDAAGDLPPNPLVPLLRTDVDHSAGTVSTSLLGAWRSTASVSQHGCTLDDGDRVIAGGGPLGESADLGDPAPLEAEVAERVEAALDAAFSEEGTGDATRGTRAVAVVHRGELVAERYADGFDATTPLLGWSMGKSLTDAVIGRLVLDGVVDLDDDRLRPEWEGDDRANITVEQLLTMTDGLAFEEVYDPDTDATRMLFLPGDTAAYAASLPLATPPGEAWEYRSGATNILCDLAQERSGLGPELVEQLLFEPLGMRSATVAPDRTGTPVCSSFPYATARDWARFGQLYLDDGEWDGQRLLPQAWVERAFTPVASADPATPYGSQWWLNEHVDGTLRMPSVPAEAAWATGNEGQQVLVVGSADLVVVRLGLSQGFSGVDWGLEPLVAELVDALG